jgi:hypothetical protein
MAIQRLIHNCGVRTLGQQGRQSGTDDCFPMLDADVHGCRERRRYFK